VQTLTVSERTARPIGFLGSGMNHWRLASILAPIDDSIHSSHAVSRPLVESIMIFVAVWWTHRM
jgi:hypothetical protein